MDQVLHSSETRALASRATGGDAICIVGMGNSACDLAVGKQPFPWYLGSMLVVEGSRELSMKKPVKMVLGVLAGHSNARTGAFLARLKYSSRR